MSKLLSFRFLAVTLLASAATAQPAPPILGLTGRVSNVQVAVPAAEKISSLKSARIPVDIDMKRMAQWAMNYLIETPRKHLNYEPVFQCHPLECPPIPEGSDPVVACDTDARMDWEWYYMREISGSKRGKDVEAAFHKRIRDYIDANGKVWSHPGCYNEMQTDAKYDKKDYVIHIWGSTKILQSLSEDYLRTRNPQSKALARKVMLALKSIASWDDQGRAWFKCGMGALRADGSIVPNGWNAQPAPIVEPLITYWRATGDKEALEFAKAYSEGMLGHCQPDGIKFNPDGSFEGHGATMHAVWGTVHLGLITGNKKYLALGKSTWDFVLTRATGTGWFPDVPSHGIGPGCCLGETCAISDMMNIAAIIAKSGHTEYFDYVERYMRNYISPLQFILTPQFAAYYRRLNKSAGEANISKSLAELRKFQGGVIGLFGPNDVENALFNRPGYVMQGCCAPEGMRAIYTTWINTIERLPTSALGPAGVYVNMSFSEDSKWGRVVSFMPEQGRITVKAKVKDLFFIRPPHWAERSEVRAFVNSKRIPVRWSGSHVRFQAKPGDELTITYPLVSFKHEVDGIWSYHAPDLKMTFNWLGNMVTSVNPPARNTPLFVGKPRTLPVPP